MIPEDPNSEEGESGPDLSTLRTFRVLRPLKLVSGVPSKRRATVAYNCPPVAVKYVIQPMYFYVYPLAAIALTQCMILPNCTSCNENSCSSRISIKKILWAWPFNL